MVCKTFEFMDFLDPKKKRANQIKLFIGHILMMLIVATATYILVLKAYGYGFDTETGQVTQNGIVYLATAPDQADIKINGKSYDQTNTRLSLEEGDYSVDFTKSGYTSWHHQLNLEGGKVEHLDYSLLFPIKLKTQQINKFDSKISLFTESPDRRWILTSSAKNISEWVEYDLKNRKNDLPVSEKLSLPANVFTASSGASTLKLIEWSTDNKHLLVQHKWSKGSEYVMVNRESPKDSLNLTSRLGVNPTKIAMIDKKFDKLFLYFQKTKILTKYDVDNNENSEFAKNVVGFKPHGSKKVFLARTIKNNQVEISLIDGNKTYGMRKIPAAGNIKLDIAQYNGDWYTVFNSPIEKKTYIYQNPQKLFRENPDYKDSLAIVLDNGDKVDSISFSQNARFIMARSGQKFSVYDAENNRRSKYTIKEKFDSGSKPVWMDGYRIITSSKGRIIVFEFDGKNLIKLNSADPAHLVLFDQDYKELYSLGFDSKDKSIPALFVTQLRLPVDK